MTYTGAQIEQIARQNDWQVSTVIPSRFDETEYKAVRLKMGITAFFLMDNNTFDYSYSHTYNALTDKTTKSKPKGF